MTKSPSKEALDDKLVFKVQEQEEQLKTLTHLVNVLKQQRDQYLDLYTQTLTALNLKEQNEHVEASDQRNDTDETVSIPRKIGE